MTSNSIAMWPSSHYVAKRFKVRTARIGAHFFPPYKNSLASLPAGQPWAAHSLSTDADKKAADASPPLETQQESLVSPKDTAKKSESVWEQAKLRPGDWKCSECSFHNFARNKQCKSCGKQSSSEIGNLNETDFSEQRRVLSPYEDRVPIKKFESMAALSTKQVEPITGPLSSTAFRPYLLKPKKPFPASWDTPGGIVALIDKPKGWTSFAVCGRLKSLTRIRKVGHAGTLDPMATGLLIVCIGKATKLADSYQAMVKEYSGTFRLGEATSSYDAETEVIERQPWLHVRDEDMAAAAESFLGDQMQVPPMYSAIKVKGVKMYEKARKGEQVDLPPRPIKIHQLRVQRSPHNPQDFDFRTVCSKGTYVRSLVYDLARCVGSCAHLTALRREMIGDYDVADAWDMADLIHRFEAEKEESITNVVFNRGGS